VTLQPRARFVADCVYAQTGCGKTYQIAKAAERLWRVRKKKTRYIGGDSGGFDTLGDLVVYNEDGSVDTDRSVVLPFIIANDPYPIETMDRLVQGYWLNKEGKLAQGPLPQEVGQYAIEGLTSIGDLMMRHLSATKTRLSQDPAYTYKDGVTEFSGTNMSYYGEVQNRLYDMVVKSSVLPVEKVIWTALEGRGEEEGTKAPTFGPSIVGKKSTGKAGQWFGNMVHLEILVTEKADPATKQLNIEQRRVMYLQPHADPVTKIPFPAKVRAPFNRATEVPFLMDPPDLGKLYDLLESLRQPKEAAGGIHN
jgi:hypothetical protein